MNLRKAAQAVLDRWDGKWDWLDAGPTADLMKDLRAALAEPEQEPVAWAYVNSDGECEQIEYDTPPDHPSITFLYAAPPQRKLLTIEEAVAAERDECAKIVERNAAVCIHSLTLWDVLNANALAIRARGYTNEQ